MPSEPFASLSGAVAEAEKIARAHCVSDGSDPLAEFAAGEDPPQARLGDLLGLAAGLDPQTTGMVESGPFEPTKAYKDAKAANVLTMKVLSDRYGRDGVTSVAIFPGCVADSNLLREKRGWFRYVFFPIHQKYIIRQYVPNDEAGRRVPEVATQGQFSDSGSYYQWRGKYTDGG